jgi:hypothetical protein
VSDQSAGVAGSPIVATEDQSGNGRYSRARLRDDQQPKLPGRVNQRLEHEFGVAAEYQ